MADLNDGSNGRIIGLLDMDCFECQIYQRDNPRTLGKPCVVANSHTRIVSVNYEAKAYKITRSDTVEEARSKCQARGAFLKVMRIPKVNGKPDSYKLRSASDEVLKVLESQCEKYYNMILDFSPSDEFYVDMTQEVSSNIFAFRNFFCFDYLCKFVHFIAKYAIYLIALILLMALSVKGVHTLMSLLLSGFFVFMVLKELRGISVAVRLLYGEVLMQRMCNEVYRQTKMTASAGVSTNKFRAKLASSENKPAGVFSILPAKFESLLLTKKLKDVPGLKSGLGEAITEQFGIMTMEELQNISEENLRQTFNDEQVDKILRFQIGFDDSPVIPKTTTKSVSCRKSYVLESVEGSKTNSNILRKKWWRTVLAFIVSVCKWVVIRINLLKGSSRREQNLHYDIKNLSKDIICRLEEEKDRHSRQTSVITFEIKLVRDVNALHPYHETVRKRLDFNWKVKHGDIYEIAKSFMVHTQKSNGPNTRITEIGFTARHWTDCDKTVPRKKGVFRFLRFE